MKKEPVRSEKKVLADGGWLQLCRIKYIDSKGTHRTWETAERLNTRGAVLIIPRINSTGEIILVRQYRPPSDKFVVEFPAGLIDSGETPDETARRELFEETGYRCKVVKVFNPSYNSPGMSGEQITIVTAEVDEEHHAGNPPVPQMEESEDIETLIVKQTDLMPFIAAVEQNGDSVDSKVLAFALAGEYFLEK